MVQRSSVLWVGGGTIHSFLKYKKHPQGGVAKARLCFHSTHRPKLVLPKGRTAGKGTPKGSAAHPSLARLWTWPKAERNTVPKPLTRSRGRPSGAAHLATKGGRPGNFFFAKLLSIADDFLSPFNSRKMLAMWTPLGHLLHHPLMMFFQGGAQARPQQNCVKMRKNALFGNLKKCAKNAEKK